MFLIPEDYTPYIRSSIKEDILLGNTALINQVELAAQEEITAYLAGRYDTSKIFTFIRPYAVTTQYALGDYIYRTGKIYRALEAITGVDPAVEILETNSRVSLEDPRNPLIVQRMVYITLYHAHKSLPGSQIPQLRIDDYDYTIRMLEKIAAGLLNPILPEALLEDGGVVAFGSETKRQTRW